MAGDGWGWLEMAGDGWGWLGVAGGGDGWDGWRWLNGWRWHFSFAPATCRAPLSAPFFCRAARSSAAIFSASFNCCSLPAMDGNHGQLLGQKVLYSPPHSSEARSFPCRLIYVHLHVNVFCHTASFYFLFSQTLSTLGDFEDCARSSCGWLHATWFRHAGHL